MKEIRQLSIVDLILETTAMALPDLRFDEILLVCTWTAEKR